ncbi:hypothetical protein BDV96DRAFT_583090 [Lophiotrema nucula]|uniref:Peptidase C15, pyroglutamyl peptidase I-like protein n=1 Tax=Lophiotrema nucula TaxID=690887 RepID=A0A6A5YWE8_9PLEO|nr:hypothetical protein BDV96DRAFT_583090 [Lophiotrema nucula]
MIASDPTINLILYPSPIPVAYHPTISLIPELISTHQPDIILSMGVAEGRTYFAVEQTSKRRVYNVIPDIDNEVFTTEENNATWGDSPDILSTSLDLNAVVKTWQDNTQDVKWQFDINGERFSDSDSEDATVQVKGVSTMWDLGEMMPNGVQWSDAVGNYLCGFIYYTDMVEMGKTADGKERNAAFMHVPMLTTEEDLQTGVEVTVGLIEALVKTWREQHQVPT